MLKIWVIAGMALAASAGPTVGQDAAAGEQVFRRLCSPCHEIGPDAKIKLGPPLNAIDGRKAGTFEDFNYSPANKSSGITGAKRPSTSIFARRCKRCLAHEWHSWGSRMRRTLQTFGLPQAIRVRRCEGINSRV
jgi:hypothetical protein